MLSHLLFSNKKEFNCNEVHIMNTIGSNKFVNEAERYPNCGTTNFTHL